MIKIILQGGLGNQLFQYAIGYSLSKYMEQELVLDTSFYNSIINITAKNKRYCQLQLFDLEYCRFQNRIFFLYQIINKFKLYKILNNNINFICENSNCRFYQNEIIEKVNSKNNYLYGFWQNTNYFNTYIEDLRRQLVPKYNIDNQVKEILYEIRNCNSVGVHVRRSDFINLGWNKNASYYIEGMNIIKQKMPNCIFYIFSDEIEWAKENLNNFNNIKYISINSNNKDIDEFYLLQNCKNQIISESTFGWWAAYLNKNNNKIIIIPKDSKGEIFDQNWIKI